MNKKYNKYVITVMSFFNFPYNKKPSFETLVSFGLSFLILLYAFSPFWLGSRFTFQNQTGLLVVITALSTIGCAIILTKRTFTSNHPKTFTQFDVLLSVFLAYLLIQMLFYPINKEYILQLICLASVYFLFRQLPSQSVTILLFLLPISAVFQIVYGYSRLTEPWQGLSDITGGFGNTGIFGGFVAMGFVAAFGLLLLRTQMTRIMQILTRILLFVLLIPLSIQLLFSQSRAGWLAAIVGCIVLLLPLIYHKLMKRNKLIMIVLLLIIGAFLSGSLYHFKKDSADGRVLIWTVSAKMMAEKPITGFGIDGFKKNYLLYQGEYFKNNPDSRFADLADNATSPFNKWLKIGVEQGIIGLLLVFGILFMAFRASVHSPPLRVVLAALMVFACFSYPFEFMAFQVLAVFCLARAPSNSPSGGESGQQYKQRVAESPLRGLGASICVLLIISACGFVIFTSYNRYINIKDWNRAFYAYQPKERVDILQTLYPTLQHNAQFVFSYGNTLYSVERYAEAIPVLEEAKELFPSAHIFMLLGELYEKMGSYPEALEAWQTASYIRPVLFAPHYNMAKLYQKLGESSLSCGEGSGERLAKQKAELILQKRVKINSHRIVRMKKEMEILLESEELPFPQDNSLSY
jgi:O-antigen ligase